MTGKILEEFKERITHLQLEPYSDGRFEVFINGDKIYSKKQTHEFPEYAEIQAALHKKR